MFTHLLHQFGRRMPPSAWLELVLQRESPFFCLFTHSRYGHRILQTAWSYFIACLPKLPEHHVTVLVVDPPGTNVVLDWDAIRNDPNLFNRIDQAVTSRSGWTAFANALRWGTFGTVKWMLDQCPDAPALLADVRCMTYTSRVRIDTSLTLSLYNDDTDALDLILGHLGNDSARIRRMLSEDCSSMAHALARVWFFYPEKAVKRFDRLLAVCSEIAESKNSILSALLAEWTARAHRRPNGGRDVFENFEENRLLRRVLELPTALHHAHAVGLFGKCTRVDRFDRFITDLFGKYRMFAPVDAYVACVCDDNMSLDHLLAFESNASVRPNLAGAQRNSAELVSAWATRPAPQLEHFLTRAKTDWHLNLYHVLSPAYPLHSPPRQEHWPWYTFLRNGMVPLVMYHPQYLYNARTTPLPGFLTRMLKAFRMLRRCVQRRWRSIRTTCPLHRCHRRMRFMIQCRPPTRISVSISLGTTPNLRTCPEQSGGGAKYAECFVKQPDGNGTNSLPLPLLEIRSC
jgi:hypothetical protein